MLNNESAYHGASIQSKRSGWGIIAHKTNQSKVQGMISEESSTAKVSCPDYINYTSTILELYWKW
ncbi:hypothetical protein [Sphingobacterium siyangense]|uniref:Uncharacterized protein n=1 Tax=Sphingobacterium multivorum TaxID=28454 RepID=A0A654D1D6_SPHMU|nr:hypothetical protein SPHINGO8BC_51388 [Sphingobacterium multivorum]